jgi:RsiW-degrading membrane proteinase PrsW (M82 family)
LEEKPLFQHLHKSNFHGAPFQHVAVPDPVSTLMPQLHRRHYALFWGTLIGGFAGLVGLTDLTIQSHSRTVEEVFIVVGSLLVPVLFVYYMDLRSLFVEPRFRTLFGAFTLGAVIAVPLAGILEYFLPAGTGSIGPAFLTGFIEEGCKATALFWLLLRRHRYLRFEMDGIILGAAAGMGFAAFEDMLYGASSFQNGVHNVVLTVWLRQLLGPFGHGTWTAIVAGAIWAAKGSGRPRITWSVVGAFLVAVTLHALWDWAPLPGLWDLLWLLGVGFAGLLILRSMIHQAITQEKSTVAGASLRIGQPEPSAPPGG